MCVNIYLDICVCVGVHAQPHLWACMEDSVSHSFRFAMSVTLVQTSK